MIVTQADARRIIARHYGQEWADKTRLTTDCTVGCRPSYDPRPNLCWRKLATGKDSAVAIGVMVAGGGIDWQAHID